MSLKMLGRAAGDMIYLIKCVLYDAVPLYERVQSMDLEALREVAHTNMLTQITTMALEAAWDRNKNNTGDAAEQLRMDKDNLQRKSILTDGARGALQSYMEKSKIWYVTVGESSFSLMYPWKGIRPVSDISILYDESRCDEVMEYMESKGYDLLRLNAYQHDFCKKPPFYNFEMRRALFNKNEFPSFYDYYRNIEERLITVDGLSYGRRFSLNDYYVYMIAELYKLSKLGTTEILYMLDIMVFLMHYGDSLDFKYISKQTDAMGLTDFQAQFRGISERTFEKLGSPEPEICSYITFADEYDRMVRDTIKSELSQQETTGEASKIAEEASEKSESHPKYSEKEQSLKQSARVPKIEEMPIKRQRFSFMSRFRKNKK